MRQLTPGGTGEIDAAAAYANDERPAPDGRPWLVLDMIVTADGATALGGVTKQLGGRGDRAVFRALRGVADVILVGAGTVRAENYGQPKRAPGQAAQPRLAVVSGRLDLDPSARLFTEPGPRPLVVTASAAPADRLAALADVADIVVAGDSVVEVGVALGELGSMGARVVLCEGGPTLNGQLVAAGLVDELCVTVAPCLAVGMSSRLTRGPELTTPYTLRLDRVLEEEDYLFLRYVRRP